MFYEWYKTTIIGALLLMVFGFFYPSQTSFADQIPLITQTLSLGSSGPQVVALQKILNLSPVTQVSATGDGSLGHETGYFGIKTQLAVKNFQQIYTKDILGPVGLSTPTGIVGPATRNKLNSLRGLTPIVQNSQPQTYGGDALAQYRVTDSEKINVHAQDSAISQLQQRISDKINTALAQHIAPVFTQADYTISSLKVSISLNSHQGWSDDSLIIKGGGIASQNDVYFGPNYIVRGLSSPGGSITFSVPPLPAGRYDVVVKNANGISNSDYYIIKSSSSATVNISSITPQTVGYGQTITIQGTGFTSSNNTIITTYGTITGISSPDGTRLSLKVAPDILRENALQSGGREKVKMGIDIVNDNGTTASTTYITISI